MNYCQFRNLTIKRMANAGGATPILPPEYQQVEYLQASGAQWIDTGVNTANNLVFDVKAARTNNDSNNNVIFGALQYAQAQRYFPLNLASGGGILCGYKGTNYQTGKTWAVNTDYEYTVSIGTSTLEIVLHGDNGWTWDTPISTYGYTIQIALFGYRNSATSMNSLMTGKVYYFAVQNGNEKILDFLPCYRKSDNKPGMYDLVTNTFFTNAGTGDFTVGNNV